MAVSLLERNTETLEKIESRELQFNNLYNNRLYEDERHNAQISETYARLINPNAKVDEVLGRVQADTAVKQEPYLVENARADAEIFRADSPINRRVIDVQPVYSEQDSEEENEDLMPTKTTIQYKTTDVKRTAEEGKIEDTAAKKHISVFSKKEKLIIAIVIGVIVAMFTLIIVNSAFLSGINNDVSSLQSTLASVKASYASISDEVNAYVSNAVKDVEDFAVFKGMVR